MRYFNSLCCGHTCGHVFQVGGIGRIVTVPKLYFLFNTWAKEMKKYLPEMQ